MKKKIHPKYYTNVTVTCSCGNSFIIGGATVKSISTEYCYKCHPAYTGEHKVADVTSKIKKFETRLKKTAQKKKQIEKLEKERKKKKAKAAPQNTITLRDLLKTVKRKG